MAGLFEKARIAALSAAHALLDKVDLNSIEPSQYIRDLKGLWKTWRRYGGSLWSC